MKSRNGFLVDIEEVVVYTSSAVIIKENLPFCTEFSMCFIRYRDIVDRFVYL